MTSMPKFVTYRVKVERIILIVKITHRYFPKKCFSARQFRSFDGSSMRIKGAKTFFTITAEVHTRSSANFYCQYAERHMNLKFMRRVSEREPALPGICGLYGYVPL